MAMRENLKKRSMNELPQHSRLPLNEIFTRLLVKSLLRCKSVSKYWLSLISDPEFVKDHYKNGAIKNPSDLDCLVANKNNVGLVILSRQVETCILPPDRYELFGSIHRYELFGSIHGLLLCRNAEYSSLNVDEKFWIWNPAIHQSKEFTFPHGIHRWSHYDPHVVGFGFDPENND